MRERRKIRLLSSYDHNNKEQKMSCNFFLPWMNFFQHVNQSLKNCWGWRPLHILAKVTRLAHIAKPFHNHEDVVTHFVTLETSHDQVHSAQLPCLLSCQGSSYHLHNKSSAAHLHLRQMWKIFRKWKLPSHRTFSFYLCIFFGATYVYFHGGGGGEGFHFTIRMQEMNNIKD